MKQPDSTFENPTKGEPAQVVLADVFLIGKVKSENRFVAEDDPKRVQTREMVRVVLQLEERNSKGYRHQIAATYPYSLHPKSSFMKLFTGWLGRSLTKDDLDAMETKMVGKLNGLLTIAWKASKNGDAEFANIGSVSGLPKAIPAITVEEYKRRAIKLKPWEELIEKAEGVTYVTEGDNGSREPGDENDSDVGF